MLATNSILQQGRYRIIEGFFSTPGGWLYDAYDNLLGNKVVIHETVATHSKVFTAVERNTVAASFTGRLVRLKELRCDALIRVRDGFGEVDRQYLVTEPVEGRMTTAAALERPVETVAGLLSAIDAIRLLDGDDAIVDITPAHIRRTSSGSYQMLYFGPPSSSSEEERQPRDVTPYRAIEELWDGLDLASQKAISYVYDDHALGILESPVDVRTAIYSLGATLYNLMTGLTPADALERSIELLDGNRDPLIPACDVDPMIPASLNEFVLKAMQLRREHRYQSVVDAKAALDALPQLYTIPVTAAAENHQPDKDFLEVPPTALTPTVVPSMPPERHVDQLALAQTEDVVGAGNPQVDLAAMKETSDLTRKIGAVPDAPPASVKPAQYVVPLDDDPSNDFTLDLLRTPPVTNGKAFRYAAGVIMATAMIAVAVWAISSFTSATGTTVVDARESQRQSVDSTPQPTPPPAVTVVVPDEAPLPETPMQTDEKAAKSVPTQQPLTKTKAARPTDTTAVPKQLPRSKKPVTVDDLISDN